MAIGLDLDQYQLKQRVLLVFAPDPQDARYTEQHAYLRADAELLDEWRIVEFGIFERGPSFAEQRAVSHEESERARERFGFTPGDFGLCLVDLDGSEILRSREPIPIDHLVDVAEAKPTGADALAAGRRRARARA
jgi:hypothetical protein